jgi:hypothetical protein
MVCHAPSSRASSPPSAYPTAAATTAPKNNRSVHCSWPKPPGCARANATAAMAPAPVAIQNATRGRSRPRSTAIVAVAAGSSAITTAPWLAGAAVSAKDVSMGKPTTTPPATTARRSHCVPRGRRCRVSTRAAAARTAATTARAEPMNNGSSPSTASRVNGTVKEKASTPRRPHQIPACEDPPRDDPAGDDIAGRT